MGEGEIYMVVKATETPIRNLDVRDQKTRVRHDVLLYYFRYSTTV